MTSISFVLNLIDNRWHEEIEGRIEPVEKPAIARQLEDARRRLRTTDLLEVQDGGSSQVTPLGIGWNEEEVTSRITIDIRTTSRDEIPGNQRLFGVRGEDGLPERYGGLTGEVRRILDTVRKGHGEYELIEGFEVNDISGTTGRGHYRAVVEVRLTEYALSIDPEPYPSGSGTESETTTEDETNA